MLSPVPVALVQHTVLSKIPENQGYGRNDNPSRQRQGASGQCRGLAVHSKQSPVVEPPISEQSQT